MLLTLKDLIEYIMDNYNTSTIMKNSFVADRIRHGMNDIPDTKKYHRLDSNFTVQLVREHGLKFHGLAYLTY